MLPRTTARFAGAALPILTFCGCAGGRGAPQAGPAAWVEAWDGRETGKKAARVK